MNGILEFYKKIQAWWSQQFCGQMVVCKWLTFYKVPNSAVQILQFEREIKNNNNNI